MNEYECNEKYEAKAYVHIAWRLSFCEQKENSLAISNVNNEG